MSRRRAGCAAVALLAAACGGATAQKPKQSRVLTPAEIARRSLPSVVRINTDHGHLGTGFVVGADGRIATNLHVVEGARRVRVTFSDGKAFDVESIAGIDAAHDLAIVRIPSPSLPALRLWEGTLELGQRVVAIGHPIGMENTVSDGLVSAVRGKGREQLVQISAPISQGSSGGPVFDDRGRVIGVATLTSRVGQNLNFAMPARFLLRLAREDARAPISSLPDHSARNIFGGCSSEALANLYAGLQSARRGGDDLVEAGHRDDLVAYYRLAAADMLLRAPPSCALPRKIFLRALTIADQRKDDKARATEFRVVFDWLVGRLFAALK